MAARLQEALRKPDLRRLASNPLLLTVMALVHTHDKILPDHRVVLYERTVAILLWRWETHKRKDDVGEVGGGGKVAVGESHGPGGGNGTIHSAAAASTGASAVTSLRFVGRSLSGDADGCPVGNPRYGAKIELKYHVFDIT
ncbi:MAG: hypothetical protein V7849_13280 [Candidatus Competibacter sp.]